MFSFNEFTEITKIDEAKDEFHSAVKKLHTDGGLNADDMSRNLKDGTITLHRGFFYRHGKDSQSFANEISKKLTDAGVHHTVVNHGEVDKPFKGGGSTKQNSHFHVTIKPKTVNEEVEQIDELSKDTVYSYKNKAEKDLGKRHSDLGKQIKAGKSNVANANAIVIAKRMSGVDKAEDRLQKEDYIAEEEDDKIFKNPNAKIKGASFADASKAEHKKAIKYHTDEARRHSEPGMTPHFRKTGVIFHKMRAKMHADHLKSMNEEVELDEKTLTPAELKKREEIAKAMERENPGMNMGKKMAIATAAAKRVAEGVEQIDELEQSTLKSLAKKRSDQAFREQDPEKKATFSKKADKANWRHADAPSKITRKPAPKAINTTGSGKSYNDGSFGANRGYGQGRYMGDSVELNGNQIDEALTPKGHTIEAHGIRGMKATPWRKTFKHYDHLAKWADENDSVEVHGTRDLEQTKRGNLSPAMREETLDEAKHVINVTVSDPNHSAVSKRKETFQRRATVTAKDRESAVNTALHHYKKQGLKVHDHTYVGLKEETLDELSKKTLGSYVKAAAKDAEQAGQDQEHYGDKSDYARGNKRQNGISKAIDRLTKEETLDELSKKTLGSYIKKADTSRAFNAGRAAGAGYNDKGDRLYKKSEKRGAGVRKAVDKLTKENVELDEGSFNESASENASRLKKAMDMDFSRMMHGAMSRDEYNKKWKKGKYAEKSGKYKLDPTGVYHNLIKTVKEESMLTYNQLIQNLTEAAEVEVEKKTASRADKKIGKDGRKYPAGKIKFNDGNEDGSRVTEEIDLEDFTLEQIVEFMESDEFLTLDEENQDVVNDFVNDAIEFMSEEVEELDEVEGKVYQHKGTYGTSYDGDDTKAKKPAPTVSRGRGRPKKGSDETGEVKKFDFSQFTNKVKLPKFKGTVTSHKI